MSGFTGSVWSEHDRPSVAIIGAGIAGLTAARMLAERGLVVKLFEKSRGPGGRMASRRAEATTFDHGAQYFTARDERFRTAVSDWVNDGIVSEWVGRIGVFEDGSTRVQQGHTRRFAGVPRMSALTRYLSRWLTISFKTRIASVERQSSGRWLLKDDTGKERGEFEYVLCTLPPEQAVQIIDGGGILARHASNVRMKPCWALMATFDQRVPLEFDGLFVNDSSSLSWIARNSSKPGRPSTETWVLHSSSSWAEKHVADDKSAVADALLADFYAISGSPRWTPLHSEAHLWRYARAHTPLHDEVLWDETQTMALIGDWTNGSRVEGAFLSGFAAAEHILAERNDLHMAPDR